MPKGRLLDETAALLHLAGWELTDYHREARSYHLKSRRFPALCLRVFHEKDIPIQVAVGNYDLGICGLDWVEELLAKYPTSALVKVQDLGYNMGSLYAAASKSARMTMEGLRTEKSVIRLASEYPYLAESFALGLRLRQFRIFPLWGAAEVYPPESADLTLVRAGTEAELSSYDLAPINKVLDFSAFLIANQTSWEKKDMGEVLDSLGDKMPARFPSPAKPAALGTPGEQPRAGTDEDAVWLALPDGHQQPPTLELLRKAGIHIDDYPSPTGNRRPRVNLPGTLVKTVRPQDMPLQVANGNFDLAITGRDWLLEHLYQFPSSPAAELADLKFGKVKIAAVISKELSMADVHSLAPLRIASEYVNIADKYARDNHLGPYRIIPTWGASEAFVPEDADLLIENAQTGRTIARHNLKITDVLFESTACLIGAKSGTYRPAKSRRIENIVNTLRAAVEDA